MQKVIVFIVMLSGFAWMGHCQAEAKTHDYDVQVYRDAMLLAKSGKWRAAISLAEDKGAVVPAKLLRWLYYTMPSEDTGFEEIAQFIEKNPEWPSQQILQRRAEESISANVSSERVIEWFKNYPPLSAQGQSALGTAHQAKGDEAKAGEIIRKAWINGNFGTLQERQFLSSHRGIIGAKEHQARLDRLLWDRQESQARRQILRVDNDHKNLALARLALVAAKGGASSAIDKVPQHLRNDPGLEFDRLRWRRKKDMIIEAISILKNSPHDLKRPDLWWNERALIARKALQIGHISDAYHIVRKHGLQEGPNFAEAEWMAGWIALRFLDDKDAAFNHFQKMYKASSSSISKSRGAYWAGRAMEAKSNKGEAEKWFREAANAGTTYYGQLAQAKLGDNGWVLPSDPLPSPEDIENFNGNELVRALRLLMAVSQTEYLRNFIMRIHDNAKTPGQRTLAAVLAVHHDRHDLAVAVARRSDRTGITLAASGWPTPSLPFPKGFSDNPEKALILALIRQESAFQVDAISPAKAMGLMQLMPATAKSMARILDMKFNQPSLTQDPAYNIKMGTAYLQDLIKRFNGSYIMALAAYNAGPGRVAKWMREFGDPRATDVDPIDWVEQIPFNETRNYVQRVMESLQVYRRRLGATELALTLDKDLKRSYKGTPEDTSNLLADQNGDEDDFPPQPDPVADF